jgi:hypothetical protein
MSVHSELVVSLSRRCGDITIAKVVALSLFSIKADVVGVEENDRAIYFIKGYIS